MPMSGMDVAQVRQLANQLRQSADQVRGLTTRLTGQLNSTIWQGPDHTRFLHEWNSVHVRSLSMVATSLTEAAGSASREADQQEQASS